MTRLGLVLRNLVYHRRGNLAIFLGMVLGAAVLTGALLVGDSLRGSLRALTLDQLGWIDQAMVSERFFRAMLANDLPAEHKASAIVLRAAAVRETGPSPSASMQVNLLGVDDSFWPAGSVPVNREFWRGEDKEVVINASLAASLNAKVGDDITFSVHKAEGIPRESLLGKRDDATQAMTLRVGLILHDEGMARFTLKPSPDPVRNAFVPIKALQDRLSLTDQANAIFVGSGSGNLPEWLQTHLTLADWNLRLRTPADRARDLVKFLDPKNKDGNLARKKWQGRVPAPLADQADANGVLTAARINAFYERERGYVSLESKQLYLDAVVEGAAAHLPWRSRPSQVYLADTIEVNGAAMPYAVVAAPGPNLNQDDLIGKIDLAIWPGATWQARPGDPVHLTYYVPDEMGRLQKRTRTLPCRQLVKLEGPLDDSDLTPQFPGITDQLEVRKWENPPFPYDPKRVGKLDEQYWERYRATPRAWVSLATAKEMWGSRFGNYTAIHFFPHEMETAASMAEPLRRELLTQLGTAPGGFQFQPVRRLALMASVSPNDFGVLFLAFSFFLIAAALLLIGLLIRLNLDRRGPEIGLLLATGWNPRRVRRLLLGEGGVLALFGGLGGLGLALVYARFMIDLLQASWPGGQKLSFLRLHVEPTTFLIGYLASLAVTWFTILWATRVLGKLAPRALLAGASTEQASHEKTRGRWLPWLIGASLVGAGVCAWVGQIAPDHAAQSGAFFGGGTFMLVACLMGLAWWFRSAQSVSSRLPSLTVLGLRNAGRHRTRSLLTIGILAGATFLITAVESFHKEVDEAFHNRQGGSGGFALMAEATAPVFKDLDDPGVRNEYQLPRDLFQGVTIHALRLRAGDDASCLNLYKPLQPRLLGVSGRLRREGRFQIATSSDKSGNPWDLLESKQEAIPVFVDANTAQWILKVGLGDTIESTSGQGAVVNLQVVGLLKESIFQSEILMAEENFLKLFPRQEGFNFFLVDCADQDPSAIQSSLAKALSDHGLEVVQTQDRLRAYLAVENMYLATFQALGQLGLALGALGLAIVLLRSAWERRGELALLQALGFGKSSLAWLVMVENGFLLGAGLASGALSALVAVMPHFSGGGMILWQRLAWSLGLVALIGLGAGWVAVVATLRAPILAALRRE